MRKQKDWHDASSHERQERVLQRYATAKHLLQNEFVILNNHETQQCLRLANSANDKLGWQANHRKSLKCLTSLHSLLREGIDETVRVCGATAITLAQRREALEAEARLAVAANHLVTFRLL